MSPPKGQSRPQAPLMVRVQVYKIGADVNEQDKIVDFFQSAKWLRDLQIWAFTHNRGVEIYNLEDMPSDEV